MPESYQANKPLTISLSGDETAIRRTMTQLFEATSDAVFFLNRDWVFTFLNRHAQETLSPSGKVLGTVLWDSFPQAAKANSPFRINLARTMNQGIATDFEAFYGAPLNLWYEVHAFPSDDGIIVFFRDITRGKSSRAELEAKTLEVERQFAEIESLYRTAPIGLALFDLDDYRYLRLNERQAAFFGMRPEEIVGRTLTEMAPIEGLRELFDGVAAGTPVINYQLEGSLVTDPDTLRYWTVSYYPVIGPDGNVQAITAASLEITQQKKVELALIESEKLAVVGRLASSIAHEINNPLEAVTNLLYLARISPDVNDVRTYVQQAETELQRVAQITSQTLRFHKQATSPQEISALNLLESVRSVYQGKLLNANVRVEQRHRTTAPIRCFEGEIRQVISNLLGNALDAMPVGEGRILLRSRTATDARSGKLMLTLTIADNGSGMSRQTVENAFRPFYTTKGILGTGLGLWISDEIMKRHGGSLRVRSREGHGTVFNISLPYDAVTR